MPKYKPQIRVYIPEDTDRLLKLLAAFKDSSVNALVNEAIEQWLENQEQREIIEKHKLEED